MNRTFILAAAVAALPLAGQADHTHGAHAEEGALTISGAYARSTNPKVGAVFMAIGNSGASDCVLTGVAAPEVTDKAELHTHQEKDGVMSMVRIESVTIPAGGSHALQRGGDHIMLMKPKAPVAQGQVVAMTLDFGACGTVPLSVTIDNNAGPKGPAMGMGGMGGMGQMHHDHMMHGGMAPSN